MNLTPEELEELKALEMEMMPKQQRSPSQGRRPNDLSMNMNLTPEELEELQALEAEFAPSVVEENPQQNSLFESTLETLGAAGNAIDSYTGAPVRQFVGTLADGEGLGQALSNTFNQVGEDPLNAPTGKEIVMKMGVSDETSRPYRSARDGFTTKANEGNLLSEADLLGFGADMLLDVTNLLPFVGVAGQAAKKGVKGATALKGSANASKIDDAARFTKVAGSTGEAAVESTKNAAKQLKKLFSPDIAPDFNELSEIAAKHNIPKGLINEAIEFGEDSVISRHARSIAEGPLGGDKLAKHNQLVAAVSDAAENTISKLGGGSHIADPVEAGALIRQSFDEGIDRFFDGMAETYQNAVKMGAGFDTPLTLDKKSKTILNTKMNDLEQWAIKRIGDTKEFDQVLATPGIKKGEAIKAMNGQLDVLSSTNKAITKTQKAQAREVLEAVKMVKKSMADSGGDLNQVYSAMRDLGEIAFKTSNSMAELPSDTRKFQEMYFSLQKGMTESIRTGLGDEFADALIENNKKMSDLFTKRGVLANVLGNKNISDEKVFQSLIVNGDTKKIKALFDIISPESAQQLKASFLDQNLVRDADGVINFISSRKKLNKLKDSGKLKAIFSVDELKDLDDVLRLGDRAGIGVMSTSGTGASNSFRNIKETLVNRIGGDTLIEGLKNKARSNYVEMPVVGPNGVEYMERLKKAPTTQGKKGVDLLKGKDATKRAGQGIKALRASGAYERNKEE